MALSGIFFLPLYLKYMGGEAYGLVGFFTMLQALFTLLDVGLTPTMARETARFRGGAVSAQDYRLFFRALESIFLLIAVGGGVLLWSAADLIADRWLNRLDLSLEVVGASIELMAGAIACRWLSGFYRGSISGSERIVWLSGYNAFVATLRFVGVIAVLSKISSSPIAFFSYQLVIGLLELAGLGFYAYRLLPPVPAGLKLPLLSLSPLRGSIKFSLTVAFTSTVWILMTQLDKLVLSKVLGLSEYGQFTLGVLLASAVTVVTGPVSSALMPRMARLEAKGDHEGVIDIYRKCTQLVAVIAGAVAITLAVFAEELLWLWTHDRAIAVSAAPIMRLYALGNAVLAVAAFPYYLQYARGDLRLHLYGNALLLLFLVPSIVWAAANFGGVGAGYAWLATNVMYLLFWVPVVHRRLQPGLHMKWIFIDIGLVCLFITLSGYCISLLHISLDQNRGWIVAYILAAGIAVLMVGVASSMYFWRTVKEVLRAGGLRRKGV